METVQHFINGKVVSGSGSRFGDVHNPALGRVIRKVSFAEQADARNAINAAHDVYPAWRDTSLAKRTQIMFA
ncbi:MAG: aldehyde dehydrogenase family protein, partial [Acidobacteria bacterium]|nr:aldehyde dehydrogenase family protein [Acidobacteriota bacterium]